MANKTIYCLSFGSKKKSGINVDLIVPIRSDDVETYRNELIDYSYEMSKLTPVTISVGYHFEF
ncbi:MAG: hypothetical protein JEY96_16180 [Bacteroidales bacterium]|nr:hypothetical protein [Bacteroidales bacterium]